MAIASSTLKTFLTETPVLEVSTIAARSISRRPAAAYRFMARSGGA